MKDQKEELTERIVETERAFQSAKKNLAEARRRYDAAETLLIETKLAKEQAIEDMRVFRNTTPKVEPTQREQDIQRFREKFPELCLEAYERDCNRE